MWSRLQCILLRFQMISIYLFLIQWSNMLQCFQQLPSGFQTQLCQTNVSCRPLMSCFTSIVSNHSHVDTEFNSRFRWRGLYESSNCISVLNTEELRYLDTVMEKKNIVIKIFLKNIIKDYCGIIIICGVSMFVDYWRTPTHEFTSPLAFSKVMNCPVL